MEFEERRNKKIQLLQAENQDKDLEGCTFQPKIYSVEEGYQKRNLDQFLEDQNNFAKKVNKKIEDEKVKASLLEESIMHPIIDDVSRRIVEEKLADSRYARPIHERLFDLGKELQEKKESQRQQEDL